MGKLFVGAVIIAAGLAAAVSARAATPDAAPALSQPEPAAQAVVAQAHLIFAAGPGAPVVSDLTVLQHGGDFAVVRTSFSAPAAPADAPVAPGPPTKDRAASRTEG